MMDVAFLAEFFTNLARDLELDRVAFVWHGGEPLTLGISYLRKQFYLQQQMLSDKTWIRNTIQTNGYLLNDEWAMHLAAYKFSVGVSIDGPREIHDRMRQITNGKGTLERCLKGIGALQRYKISFGILTVVSETLLQGGAEKLIDFFEEYKIPNYALLALRKNWPRSSAALAYNHALGRFMGDAAKVWFDRDNPKTHIREIESKLDRLFGLPAHICKDRGCCVGKYFGVEADGSVWHCDKFLTDPRFYLGNIHQQSFSSIRTSPRLTALMRYETEVKQRCRPCKWFQLCGGGCLYDAIHFASVNGRPGTTDCPSFSLLERLSRLIATSPAILQAARSQGTDQPLSV